MEVTIDEDDLRLEHTVGSIASDFSLSGLGISDKDSGINDAQEVQETVLRGWNESPRTPSCEEEEFVVGCLSTDVLERELQGNGSQRTKIFGESPLIRTPLIGHSSQTSSEDMGPMETPMLLKSTSKEDDYQMGEGSSTSLFNNSKKDHFNESQNLMLRSNNTEWNFPLPLGTGARSLSTELAMSLDHLDLSNRSILSEAQRATLSETFGTAVPPPPPQELSPEGNSAMNGSHDVFGLSGSNPWLFLQKCDDIETMTEDEKLECVGPPRNGGESCVDNRLPIRQRNQPTVLQAVYETSQTPAVQQDGTAMVMSSTRREWLNQLNAQAPGVRGNVLAAGSVTITEKGGHQGLRRVMAVVPSADELHSVQPIFRVNVSGLQRVGDSLSGRQERVAHDKQDLRAFALAKPAFSPFETGTMALGSEAQPSTVATEPKLIITQIQRSAPGRITHTASTTLNDHVCGIEWLSAAELLVAGGSDMVVFKIHNQTLRQRFLLPRMHSAPIREVQLSIFNRSLCLSGGYDGQVFVTDLEKVISDQLSARSETFNSRYSPMASVSSVQWNPGLTGVASATTDSGLLHIFDSRLRNATKPTTVLDTREKGLYTHAWADTYSTLLGYGDGTIRVFDMRRAERCVVSFSDPFVSTIGDIAFDPQRRFFVTFGHPSFSVWRSQAHSAFTLWHRDPDCVSKHQLDADPFYKNSGAFMLTGGRQHGLFATADSHGYVALYDVHTADHAAVTLQ